MNEKFVNPPLPEPVSRMMRKPGIYLVGSTESGDNVKPVYVDHEGRCFEVNLGARLRSRRWTQKVEVYGPLNLSSPKI